MTAFDSGKLARHLRNKLVQPESEKVLITNFRESLQKEDFTTKANCGGFGRIHHFRRQTSSGWPPNHLPISPAANALKKPGAPLLAAQLFQNAGCNWRCWYCYVDFDHLSANRRFSRFHSARQLLDLYEQENLAADVIVLSGGHPDLVPEWVPWFMKELTRRGLEKSIYLWSDDNLSTDFFWTEMSDELQSVVRTYRNYGRVCCLKGFDQESFQFNTAAPDILFDRQFELLSRLIQEKLDIYCYIIITSPNIDGGAEKMGKLVDRLQKIHINLPLRTVPLQIKEFSPTKGRIQAIHKLALNNQETMIAHWNREIAIRFVDKQKEWSIENVPLD